MLTGPEKAVLFLLSLDEEIAAPIVNELRETDLRKLRSVASTMSEVSADAIDLTYREFLERSGSAVAVPRGGLPSLRRLTAGALGHDRAAEVFEDGVTSPLARLEAAPPDAVASLLAAEPPQLVGAILARLEPGTAAAVVLAMTPQRQSAVLERVGRMTELPAAALEDVASALVAELPSSEADAFIGIDGVGKAAQILNAVPKDASAAILKLLDDDAPELAKDMRLAMFTFDDLKRLDSRAMRTLLREVPTERLTIALKNAADDARDAIFAGLSTRAAELIRDDLELLGNVKRSEIEKARVEIIQTALRLEADGSIDLGRGGD